MIQDEATWNDCAKDCPGMNKGKLWSFEEIKTAKEQYDANTPIYKEEVEKLISEDEWVGARTDYKY